MSNIKMTFDIEVAKSIGTDCAIILSNIEFWQYHNEVNNKNYHNGKYWTYNSISAWAKLFPYLTQSKIRRCLDKLESDGYISTGNFNKSSYDRTKWYCSNRQIDLSISANGVVKNDEPIPDNKTHIENQIKNNINIDDVFFTIDKLFEMYLDNGKIINAVIENKKNRFKNKKYLILRLNEFRDNLIESGETTKTFSDFCKHFRNWHLKTVDTKQKTLKQNITF